MQQLSVLGNSNITPSDVSRLLSEILDRPDESGRKGPTVKQFTGAVMAVCNARAEGRINDAETELLLREIGTAWSVSNFYNILGRLAEIEASQGS